MYPNRYQTEEPKPQTHMCWCYTCNADVEFTFTVGADNDHHCPMCGRLNWTSEARRCGAPIKADTFEYDRKRQGLKKTPRTYERKTNNALPKSFYDFERESWIEKYRKEGKGLCVFVKDLSVKKRSKVDDSCIEFILTAPPAGAFAENGMCEDCVIGEAMNRHIDVQNLEAIAPGCEAAQIIADEIYGEHVRGRSCVPVTRANFEAVSMLAAGE